MSGEATSFLKDECHKCVMKRVLYSSFSIWQQLRQFIMATCDSLQPIVLLTDVMESNMRQMEKVLISRNGESSNRTGSNWFPVEQTEPLNLCLNGTMFAMVECCSNEICTEESDDDVIFVKEYKVNKEKTFKGINGRKFNNKGMPRRNPVRKARIAKRFNKEYTDETYIDHETDDVGDGFADPCENIQTKNEDSEEWNVDNVLKKGKQKRKIISKKMSCGKLGRKRKVNNLKSDEINKVSFKELEPLITSNLLLIKDYIDDIKTINKIKNKENECETNKNARNLLKRQAILLAVAKNIIDGDVARYITV